MRTPPGASVPGRRCYAAASHCASTQGEDMDPYSPHVADRPLIEADLGENGGQVAFASVEEAREWIEREIDAWEQFQGRLLDPPILASHFGISDPIERNVLEHVLERQLKLPLEIRDSLAEVPPAGVGDQSGAVQRIQEIQALFQRYADHHSLYSKSEVGKEVTLFSPPGHGPLMVVGRLAGILGIPVEEIARLLVPDKESPLERNRFVLIWSGYAAGMMLDAVRRSDFEKHLTRLREGLRTVDDMVAEAKHRSTEVVGFCKSAEDEFRTFRKSAEDEWTGLRTTFEEQLRLEAPATYWRDQARRTFAFSMWALAVFAVLAAAVIGSVVSYGPDFLGRLAAIENIGNVTTLAVISLPAFTVLWGLRHVARMFVTNLERSSDAKMRETMTTTFLALSKEGSVDVGAKERLMVLEALFRQPAPAGTDDGRFGGALEVLTRPDSKG